MKSSDFYQMVRRGKEVIDSLRQQQKGQIAQQELDSLYEIFEKLGEIKSHGPPAFFQELMRVVFELVKLAYKIINS